MGNYFKKNYPNIQDMIKIVTECGRFRYNSLRTGKYASVYLFRAKVNKRLNDIEGVKNIYQ